MRRVFIIVLDSCGIGEMPDAVAFGDHDCNTLKRIAGSSDFDAVNMLHMGLGNIDGVDYLKRCPAPLAAVGRLREKSAGKDTTIGHWEIAGVVSETPLPVYPQGFPPEIMEIFEKETGRQTLCNKPYSGTQVIADYGRQHVETGALIVYTSADSVFQIAAHEDVVPLEELYRDCKIARKLLCGKHAVGRVIARPFTGTAPPYRRTANRRDFSLEAPKMTLTDAVAAAGQTVYAVGKIRDIFAGRGITKAVLTHSNAEGMETAFAAARESFKGLCFVNLVDFDMLYGHRQDIDGYAAAFAAFDRWLPGFLKELRDEDLLMITADHGCDPGDAHTDHTREYTPLMVYGKAVAPVNLGTRETFADIAATAADYLGLTWRGDGTSFLSDVLR